MQLQTISQKIAVQPPYFALEDIINLPDGSIQAFIPSQYENHHEATVMSASEIGRHLAILGSCAASQLIEGNEKHYFLANKAHLKQIEFVDKALSTSSDLTGTAYAKILNKRSAEATVFLKSKDKKIYQLDVHYNVLKEIIFERLFSNYKAPEIYHISYSDCSSIHKNPCFFYTNFHPYAQTPKLDSIIINGNQLTCSLGKITSSMCMGHFPKYPALPVAILFGALFDTSGLLLKHYLDKPAIRYYVKESIVSADNLAFANEVVSIKNTLSIEKNEFIFTGHAQTNSGKIIGEQHRTIICLAD